MTTKTIEKRINKQINSSSMKRGSYGSYFHLGDNLGIKLYHRNEYVYKKADDSIYLETYLYEAKKEYNNIISARRRYPLIPKTYGIRILKIKGEMRVGILLQHLSNKTLSKQYIEGGISAMITKIENKLKTLGILHTDIHGDNVMFYKGLYYIIDFGASHVSLSEKPKKIKTNDIN
jgi:tRNA A-37 threonylcarbamoyl transferase component Bud32